MNPEISVIVCAYNSRADYLERMLAHLRAQTLDLVRWEFIVVDNASSPPLAERMDLAWHPRAQTLREEQPGQQFARIRGLRAAAGELVVFVDDDNLLAPDYLEQALHVAREWPMLGLWSGRITGVYEQEPPGWLRQYAHHLAVFPVEQPMWSAFVDDRSLPVGAGLCVRRRVVDAYLERVNTDPNLRRLGRVGKRHVSGDDQYFAYVAASLGLGGGRFPQLRLEHLIPQGRCAPDFFLTLARGNAHGSMLLRMLWNQHRKVPLHMARALLKIIAGSVLYRGMRRRIVWAEANGELRALREVRQLS